MFESPGKLVLGLLTGVVFGFLLQKGRVGKFDVVVGQFLLRDWTMVKIMMTAVAAGALGVWFLIQNGDASLHVKPAQFGGLIIGGLLFGLGIALFGYCPGTSVAACGEGHRDAMVGVFGMLVGAGVYVGFYPSLQTVVKAFGDWGKVTFPMITHSSPWLWVGGVVAAAVVVIAALERNRIHRRVSRHPSSDMRLHVQPH